MLWILKFLDCIIKGFGKFGELGKSQNIFEELPVRDVCSWNSLILGYVRRGRLRVCGSTRDIHRKEK